VDFGPTGEGLFVSHHQEFIRLRDKIGMTKIQRLAEHIRTIEISKGIYVVLGVMVLLTSLTVVAAGTDVTACVNNKTGATRIISFLGGDCAKTETKMVWNTQGAKGDAGEKGDKGDAGDTGPAGAQLHLYDANDQDLGILTSGKLGDGYSTYLSDPAVFVLFENNDNAITFNRTVPTELRLYFEEENCSGQAFTFGIKPLELFAAEGGGYIVWTANINPSQSKLALSYLSSTGCVNNRESAGAGRQVLIKYVDLSFNLPLAWPLRIETN
jgi:hypothetical protein